jgi:6-phosphofructokinase
VTQYGYCTVAVSEGLSDAEGKLIAESGTKDAFGHSQLGGVGQIVAQLIKDKLGYKYHWALADYLQRSARHSGIEVPMWNRRTRLGVAAVELALQGKNAVMATINAAWPMLPYRWEIGDAPLARRSPTSSARCRWSSLRAGRFPHYRRLPRVSAAAD